MNQPFVYFAKRPDPISLHSAMEYVAANEQSDTIYVIHFVDDREACRGEWSELQFACLTFMYVMFGWRGKHLVLGRIVYI